MDKIAICNIALGRIGVAAIESLNEASQQARILNNYYDFVRKNVLRQFIWGFATRRLQLAQLDIVPVDYRFAYRYPKDAVLIRKVFNPEGNVTEDYKILSDKDKKVIYTNIPTAVLEYTADVEDTTLFDEQFIEAFAWKLAAEIAFSLTGRLELAQAAVQAYNAYLSEAKEKDANEDNVGEERVDRLVDARWMGA